MRTTLTIDDALYKELLEHSRMEKKSFKQYVNEVITRGLISPKLVSEPGPFTVKAHRCGRRQGIDYGKLNRLSDELEAAEYDRS